MNSFPVHDKFSIMKFKFLLISLALAIWSPVKALSADSLAQHENCCIERIVFAPRTNLLLPLLNIGMEFPLNKHLSIAGDFHYPWLGHDKDNSRCVQAILADLQLRIWFNPRVIDGMIGNTMTGHSLAIGANTGKYDFERRMKGVQGEIYSIYLDYACSFPLARHLRLSLSIGAGMAWIPYRKYTVYTKGGKLIRDNGYFHNNKQWMGPVHAGVILAIPIMKKCAH